MKKWRYKYLYIECERKKESLEEIIEKELNGLGLRGWELVSFEKNRVAYNYACMLKKEIK